jgi:hypothetical protein
LCMYNNKAWEEILLAKKVFDWAAHFLNHYIINQ